MRHDYDFPPDWDNFTEQEKSRWMTQERCRRQAMTQRTAYSRRMKKQRKRRERRQQARNETVDVEEYR